MSKVDNPKLHCKLSRC